MDRLTNPHDTQTLDLSKFVFCSEFYSVERTIEVEVLLWGDSRSVRIDALRSRDHKPAFFKAVYLREDVIMTRSRLGAEGISFVATVWVPFLISPGPRSTAPMRL